MQRPPETENSTPTHLTNKVFRRSSLRTTFVCACACCCAACGHGQTPPFREREVSSRTSFFNLFNLRLCSHNGYGIDPNLAYSCVHTESLHISLPCSHASRELLLSYEGLDFDISESVLYRSDKLKQASGLFSTSVCSLISPCLWCCRLLEKNVHPYA